MKKLFLFTALLMLSTVSLSQNVGIGTLTPAAKLEVHHRSTAAIGLKLVDSSANTAGTLQFQNINFTRGIRAEGFSASNFNNGQYLDIRTDSVIGATFKGNGFTGIRNIDPSYPLDINGDINTTGTIRVNGADGAAGQVLMKSSSGMLNWQYPEAFRNLSSFVSTGATTWVVPTGVTRIKVELWGGGASANNTISGGAGAYVMAILTVVPAQSWNITVGTGGATPGTAGAASIISRAASGITLTAGGGSVFGLPSAFSAAGTTSFFGVQGQGGTAGAVSRQSIGGINYIIYQNAPGGNAPLTSNTGGMSGTVEIPSTGEAGYYLAGYGSQPGGGGGKPNADGGNGMVVIYW
jgi:hypothetical protein